MMGMGSRRANPIKYGPACRPASPENRALPMASCSGVTIVLTSIIECEDTSVNGRNEGKKT